MKNFTLAVMVSVGLAGLAGCASKGTVNPAASKAPAADKAAAASAPADATAMNDYERRSYAIGMTLGHTFVAQGVEMDPDVMIRGLKAVKSGAPTLLTDEQMSSILSEYQKELAVKRQQFLAAVGITNKAVGEAFLATNKNNPGVVTLPDGLQYLVLTNGDGARPGTSDTVTVNYRGMTLDGKEYDSSFKRGHPAQFPIANVIHGWTEALEQMKVGSKWRLFIPPSLAWGERNMPGVTPNSVVIIEVELLGTDSPKPAAPITSDIVKVPSLEEMQKGAKIEVIKPEDAAKAQAAVTNGPAK